MSLFQKGLRAQPSAFVVRPRLVNPGIRSPLRRVRQPQRHSSSKPEPHSEGSAGDGSSVNSNAPLNSSRSNASSSASSHPPPNTAAAAAGAATTPAAANPAARRGFRQIIQASPLGRFGRWYADVQARKPYTTQVWSSIVIYLCGDLSAQLLFPSEKPAPAKNDGDDSKAPAQLKDGDEKEVTHVGYDPLRTVRHLIVGTGSSIPSYIWFMFLHNNFNYGSKFVSVLTKVVVQQICFTPVFNTYFFSLHSLLAGATFEETWERLKKALPISIKNSVKLWPAVTGFSFMYVPPQFRNVFSGVIAVGWQTYLSWLNQKAAGEVRAAELAAAAEEHQASGASRTVSGNMISAAGTA